MTRLKRWIVYGTAAFALSGCDLLWPEESHPTDERWACLGQGIQPIGPWPVCGEPVVDAIEASPMALGFDVTRTIYQTSAVVTRVETDTLRLRIDEEDLAFRWHGELPFPILEGEAVVLSQEWTWDIVRAERGQLRVLRPGILSHHGHYAMDVEVCLSQSLSCLVDEGVFGVRTTAVSSRTTLHLEPGMSGSLERWTVANLGTAHLPIPAGSHCVAGVAPRRDIGQLIAWRLDDAYTPATADTGVCSQEVLAANQSYQGLPGITGLETDNLPLTSATIWKLSPDSIVLIESGTGTKLFFDWPGELPFDLQPGQEAELSRFNHESTLRTATGELWVLVRVGFTPNLAQTRLPDGPSISFVPGCLFPQSGESTSAVIEWEQEIDQLSPGSEGVWGAWSVQHRAGLISPLFECGGGSMVDAGARLVMTAFRTFEAHEAADRPQP